MAVNNSTTIVDLNNSMAKLEAEVEILDKLTDEDTVVVQSERWDSDTAMYLSRDDVQALIDRRVEYMNELEHEIRSLED